MKRIKIILMTLLLIISLSGCSKGNPSPKPNPKPAPVNDKFVSAIGTDENIEKMIKEFNEAYKGWNAFWADQDGSDGAMFYDCWDNLDVYRGNYKDYVSHGVHPVTELVVYYDGGKSSGKIMNAYLWLSYEPVLDLGVDQFKPLEAFSIMALKAILPDLDDDQITKLADKIALPTEESYDAFTRGYADPSELTATTVDIYEPDRENAVFEIGCRYDAKYKTIILEFKIK